VFHDVTGLGLENGHNASFPNRGPSRPSLASENQKGDDFSLKGLGIPSI
jgi:hypothetical protein